MRLISTRCRAGSKRLPEQQEHCQRTNSRARLYAYGFTGERFSHHRREASPRPVRVFPIGPEGASCRRTWRQAAKGRMVARPARSRSLVRRNTRSASASRTMTTVRTIRAVTMSCSSRRSMTCAAVRLQTRRRYGFWRHEFTAPRICSVTKSLAMTGRRCTKYLPMPLPGDSENYREISRDANRG
jgi:hypothetical protein